MRINNNMSAVITNNQLLGNERSLARVMEKLSSGFSINHASDNPSGIAIAGRMKAQIDGLDQASDNSQDGVSVLQTAEGALKEVTDMIQRMRELSVQAANGTNEDAERETIQKEIEQLKEEIDRVSATTQFNTINLLDGSLDNRTYADHVTRIQTTDDVAPGTYVLIVHTAAQRASIAATTSAATLTFTSSKLTNGRVTKEISATANVAATSSFIAMINGSSWTEQTMVHSYKYAYTDNDVDIDTGLVKNTIEQPGYPLVTGTTSGTGLAVSGTICINGRSIDLARGMTGEQVYKALRDGAEKGNAIISNGDSPLSFLSEKFGTDATLTLDFSSKEFAQALGLGSYYTDPDAVIVEDTESTKRITLTGTNPDVELIKEGQMETFGFGPTATTEVTESLFGQQATVSYRDGNRVTVTNTNGFEMTFLLEDGYQENQEENIDGKVVFNVTDIGSLTLHIGANMNQEMEVRIRNINTEYMYIDDLDVTKEGGPENAISALDDALNYITSIRAQLGAYENRLDHTTNSLDETSENMTSAISRIEDADMATTMVEYTKYNVLQQAGTSALAQANELPQLALQLLQ